MPWPWQKDGLHPLNRCWQMLQARASKALRVLAGALILAFAAVIVLSKPLPFVVDATDYASVTAFGKRTKVTTSPGLGFGSAYESLRTLDRRLFVYASPPAEFLTLEKTQVIAAGSVLWRVADPRKFFETVFDRTGAESRLGDVLFAELGVAIGRSPLTAFVSTDQRTYRGDEIVPRSLGDAAKSPGAITASRWSTFSYAAEAEPPSPVRQNAIRARRISLQYRSEGEEEGLKVRALAEEKKARVLARATQLSHERRGEGDAQAARIYAQAFGQAPDFYDFLRTLEASRSLARQRTTGPPGRLCALRRAHRQQLLQRRCRRGRRRNRGRAAQEVAAGTATMEGGRMR
jgi:modulator of FtsH protease HflC